LLSSPIISDVAVRIAFHNFIAFSWHRFSAGQVLPKPVPEAWILGVKNGCGSSGRSSGESSGYRRDRYRNPISGEQNKLEHLDFPSLPGIFDGSIIAP